MLVQRDHDCIRDRLLDLRPGVAGCGRAEVARVVGLVVAFTLLVAFFFIPFFILLGWVHVVSLVFLWRERRTPAAPAKVT